MCLVTMEIVLHVKVIPTEAPQWAPSAPALSSPPFAGPAPMAYPTHDRFASSVISFTLLLYFSFALCRVLFEKPFCLVVAFLLSTGGVHSTYH